METFSKRITLLAPFLQPRKEGEDLLHVFSHARLVGAGEGPELQVLFDRDVGEDHLPSGTWEIPAATISWGCHFVISRPVNLTLPERGLISPVAFVPLAEESGLISPLGLHVLDETCRQIAAWDLELGMAAPMRANVNVSALQLDENLPRGFNYALVGRAKDFEESFYYLTITIIFSVIFIYLVLAAQFESFLHPLTILMTLPLAGIGAFGALYALGMTFSIFTFIGLIMLLGMVTKNAILLLD